ncbi:MAG: DegT/DnrJ/EryC1/StrS family aminotransferase [Bacteroidales bacterium]|nr:DegT/DnrJ/EryC1/StrS family aminotransferase [Bacteroidales bacterium]
MKGKMINIAQPSFLGNEKKYVLDTLESGWISSIGKYIECFEKAFAEYHGVKHAIATHNGTIALHLALAAAGIKKEDEVIVPDLTFIATANSVRYCNAIPVLTDVELDDWNISPADFRKKITARTKAIIPVHLYGNPGRIREIMEVARAHQLIVIEDCAEALGAKYNGNNTGTFGDIGCFSFFGNKIITTGEGGMCITNNDELAERMRILRDHGMNRCRKYWYDHLGFNYRMTNMQAAVGLAQLEQLNDFLEIRDHIYNRYMNRFRSSPEIILQSVHEQRNVNWIFTLRIKDITLTGRNALMEDLKLKEIDSRPVFYPIHQMPFYQHSDFIRGEFPNSTTISQEGISLPTYIGLQDKEIDYVADAVFESVQKNAS